MCDTLILRHQGQTWFAKNSDREPAEPQRLLRLHQGQTWFAKNSDREPAEPQRLLRLLEHLMREAAGHQARECFLEVRASNQAAYRLYERYGFNEIGRRRDYYPAVGGREDALVMACTLFD